MHRTADTVDTFAGHLPRLVNAYHRGLLVPFLGAGMSVAHDDAGCPTWSEFVGRLEEAAEVSTVSGDLIRRANHATRALARKSESALAEAVQGALYKRGTARTGQNGPEPTAATRALAAIWWPLVLTTNYDDLFLRAYSPATAARLSVPGDSFRTPTREHPGPNDEIGFEMRVVGRSVDDCDRVLLSLRKTGPSILWALHGFLPQPAAVSRRGNVLDEERRRQLASELVIGHEAYQRIAHAAVHYRRAFGEVYRQRSFLFLGSSLTDTYLLGLFAEVQELYGRSSLPHFAMVCKEDEKEGKQVDAAFLQSRFNILCVEYDRYGDLPVLLEAMNNAIEAGVTRGISWGLTAGASQGKGSRLVVEHSDLPLPAASTGDAAQHGVLTRNACVVFGSAPDGRATDDSLPFRPHVGEGIRDAVEPTNLPDLQTPSNWRESAILRKNHPKFAAMLLELKPPAGESRTAHAVVTAWLTLGQSATRDLRQISMATQAAMTWAADNGFEEVHMPLLATGRGSEIAGRASLVEMVRGYACWLERFGATRTVSLILHLRNKAALFELTSGRTDLVEILSLPSELRFWLEVMGAGEGTRSAGTDRELMLYPAKTKLKTVLSAAHLSLDGWSVEVDPPPTGGHHTLDEKSGSGSTLEQIGLISGATLRFRRAQISGERSNGINDRSPVTRPPR